MNRDRFRFRVWDNINKRYEKDLTLIDKDGNLCYQDGGKYCNGEHPEDFTIEQCSGLKDKNGKLIFEGDVVKTKYFGKDIDNRINVNDYDTFVVKFHECGFYVENDLRRFNMSCRPKLEIIGNIHEDQFREVTKKVEDDNND